MDPISMMSLGASVIGMVTQGIGMLGSMSESSKLASDEKGILSDEMQENEIRRQAMMLSANRQKIETIRKTQKASAIGMAAAVNQGAQFGSGAAGGQAAAKSQGAFDILGINQNLQLGNQIFDIDKQIDLTKMNMADIQTSLMNYQGLMGLGSGLAKSGSSLGNILGQLGMGSSMTGQKGNDLGF